MVKQFLALALISMALAATAKAELGEGEDYPSRASCKPSNRLPDWACNPGGQYCNRETGGVWTCRNGLSDRYRDGVGQSGHGGDED